MVDDAVKGGIGEMGNGVMGIIRVMGLRVVCGLPHLARRGER
jgi:hypothetical protein